MGSSATPQVFVDASYDLEKSQDAGPVSHARIGRTLAIKQQNRGR